MDEDKLEISEEAKKECQEIVNKCLKMATDDFEYICLLKAELLEQIQLKTNWNKAAQRQK